MAEAVIVLRGVPGLKRRLQNVIDLAGTPAPALEAIGQAVLDDVVAPTFEQQRGPNGIPWAPLKRSTLRARVPGTTRVRSSYGTKPLKRMGTYRSSFSWELIDGGKAVSIGTPYEWAKYHQRLPENAALDKRIMPTRRSLPVPTAAGRLPGRAQRAVAQTLDDLIEGLLNA